MLSRAAGALAVLGCLRSGQRLDVFGFNWNTDKSYFMHKMGAEGAIMARLLAAHGRAITIHPTACGGLYSCERACDNPKYRLAADGDDEACHAKARPHYPNPFSAPLRPSWRSSAGLAGWQPSRVSHWEQRRSRGPACSPKAARTRTCSAHTVPSCAAAATQALERSAAERRAQERRVEAARRAWAERWQPELDERDDEDAELDQGDAAALLAARPRRDAGVSQWAV